MSNVEKENTAEIPCRGCLAYDVKLYNIKDNNLANNYFNLVGISLKDRYSQYVCSICAALLKKFNLFREQCIKAHNLLVASRHRGKSLQEIDISTYMAPLTYKQSTIQIQEYIPQFEEKLETPDIKEEVLLDIGEDNDAYKVEYDEITIDEQIIEEQITDKGKEKQDSDEDNLPVAYLIRNNEKEKKASNKYDIKLYKNGNKVKEKKARVNKYDTNLLKNKELIDMPKTEEEIKKFANKYDFNVKFLSKEEQYDEIEEKKRERTKKRSDSTQCEYCGKKSLNQQKLYEHYKRDHDPSAGEFQCEICHWRFPYSSRLARHLNKHKVLFECKICAQKTKCQESLPSHSLQHKGKEHICPYCQKSFVIATTYFSHIRLSHSSELPWCELCGESFLNSRGMKFHKSRMHKDTVLKFECAECSVKFSSQEALDSHMTAKRCALMGCVHCGDGFATLQLLKYHLIQRHRSAIPLTHCEGCGVKFHNTRAILRHLPACGIDVCCVQCGDHFDDEASMLDHVARDHSNFKCDECNRTFSNAYYYRDHVERIHRNQEKKVRRRGVRRHSAEAPEPRVRTWLPGGEDGAVMLNGGSRNEPRLGVMCEVCGIVCNSRAKLEIHQQTHSDTRPYQCTLCSKGFRTAMALEGHSRVHTGERPFKCPSCPKAFKLTAALARHSLVHSGIRKHVCQICEKTFQTSTSVKMHIKYVHMKVPAPPRVRRRKHKDDNL